MHIVQVDSAASNVSSPNGSDAPSRPERWTGTVLASSRLRASFQPTSAGSIAATRVTAEG